MEHCHEIGWQTHFENFNLPHFHVALFFYISLEANVEKCARDFLAFNSCLRYY